MKELISEQSRLLNNPNLIPAGFQMRPARFEDLAAVVGVLNAAFQQLLGADRFSENEIGGDWERPGFNLETDSQVAVAEGGEIVAYFDVFDFTESHVQLNCWGQVHPAYTGRGLASAMLGWCETRARSSIPMAPSGTRVTLMISTLSVDRTAIRVVEHSGFKQVRRSLRMVIDLDHEIAEPDWPDGIEVREFVLGQDDEAIIYALREIFSDHWGYTEKPFELELARYRHFWATDEVFDPSLDFLAMDGDQVAGISLCYSKIEEDPEMGWVGSLGVRRPWRRKGIGLALLLHSFRAIQRRGQKRVGLGVDAQNLTGATRLYERAGMHPDKNWEWLVFEKELRSGIELSRQSLEE